MQEMYKDNKGLHGLSRDSSARWKKAVMKYESVNARLARLRIKGRI